MSTIIEAFKGVVNRVCWAVFINLVAIGAFAAWRVYNDGTLVLN